VNRQPDEGLPLSPEQQALYEQLLNRQTDAPAGLPIPRRPDPSAPAPLSYAQQRLWFFHRLEPHSPAYNIPVIFRLRGPLDGVALERSFHEIVRRHEILRATCTREGHRPAQTVAPSIDLPLERVDLGATPDPEGEIRRIATEQARKPFDLHRGPLLRTLLLRVADDDHVLIFVTHHFVNDGWSMRIWMEELSTLYAAFRDGAEPRLPELPVQYPDYASWQREASRAAALRNELEFWKGRLRDAPKELPLPFDRRTRPKTVSPGAHRRIVLARELSDRLRELGRGEGVTPFLLLLAGFQALLHRLSGSDDVVVGTPVSTRTRVETEKLIGNFANYLLLVTDCSGDPTFRELLARARTVASEAFAHQELPPELLAEELQASGEAHLIPALQVLFVLREGTLQETFRLPGIEVEPIHVDTGAARVDLYLDLSVGEQGIDGTIAYNLDRFEHATVERMVDRLRLLLERAVDDPDRRVSELLRDEELIRGAAADASTDWEADLPEFRAQTDALELELRGIWEQVLGHGPIGSDDDFFELGGSSVLAMSVYAEIRRALGVNLAEDALIQAPTIGALGRLIREGGWTSPWTHLVPLQPSGRKPGLFLIHGLEGGALPYALLTRHLGNQRPVYALQTSEIRPSEGFEDLARKYLPEIRAAQPAGPYHIGGHCTGGLVALELGHQLRAAGEEVGLMAQMDPLFIEGGIRGFLRLLRVMARWRNFLDRARRTPVGRVLLRVGARRRRHLETQLRTGARAFAANDLESVRLMEAHSRMRQRYDLKPWPGRVHIFMSDSRLARQHDPLPIWKKLAPAGLEVVKVPGRHISMLAEPNVRLLADKIGEALGEFESA